MNESREMVRISVQTLETKKALDIKVIDIGEISTIADYFLLASGNNRNQIQAMADAVDEALGRAGYNVRQIEGYQNANWILMDYKDVVIHIFDRQSRDFYDLERIWRDAKELSPDEFLAEGEKSPFDGQKRREKPKSCLSRRFYV